MTLQKQMRGQIDLRVSLQDIVEVTPSSLVIQYKIVRQGKWKYATGQMV